MDEKMAIRVLLRHYFKKGLSAHAAVTEICAVEGEGAVSYASAKRWFVRFKNGETSLEDDPRSGRPRTSLIIGSEALRQAVEATPSKSTRKLSSELGMSQSTVVRILHQLRKVNRSGPVVPDELTPAQAQKRVKIIKCDENPGAERQENDCLLLNSEPGTVGQDVSQHCTDVAIKLEDTDEQNKHLGIEEKRVEYFACPHCEHRTHLQTDMEGHVELFHKEHNYLKRPQDMCS